MQDEQLDAVSGGCGGYSQYCPSREDRKAGRSGSRRGNVVVANDVNNITVDDTNISADDGAKVFVAFVQDN